MSLEYPPTLPRPEKVASSDLTEAKQQLRVTAARQRSQIFAQFPDPELAGQMLRNSFIDRCPLPQNVRVAGYWPVSNEIDVRPLMNVLSDHGVAMAMPVVMNRNQPMRFRRWTTGLQMVPGRFGIPMPADTSPEVRPDVVLVPLLAFDRLGYRLGRGAGLYDRTLELLRATGKVLAIGIAFAGQEISAVPHDAFDQRLDWIVTERYAFPTSSGYNPLAAFGSLR
jgi:5-formyltetrahydrofolate cyclo-ligase